MKSRQARCGGRSLARSAAGALATLALLPGAAHASSFDGATLSVLWAVPFVGILLSIALWPLIAPRFWGQHFGKISAGWAAAFLLPFALVFGASEAVHAFVHAMLSEFLPFIVLLTALFVVSGGIYIRGNLKGTPLLNTGFLAVGAVLASFMGTTGASMLLIRPIIRANDQRQRCVHVIVFFIFIVSNIGGSLTPLGDPPLFMGFLKGVTFFWTAQHILPEMLVMLAILLPLFFALDTWMLRREDKAPRPDPTPTNTERFGFEGRANFALLAAIVALVLMSGVWKSKIGFEVLGTHIGLPGLVRDIGLVCVAFASLAITPAEVHQRNQFGWEPMQEVAKLFAGIFLTIVPVIAMLQAGEAGAFGAVVRAVNHADGSPNPAAYFWAAGLLSSFLDNTPTYLVFFNTASGDAMQLMGPLGATLTAISAGAVFMGANTYIGNAPNLMVKAIAEDRGVKMPSFFGYMAWSFGILVPLFALLTFIFF